MPERMKFDRLDVSLARLRVACHNPVLNLLRTLNREIARIVQQIKQAEDTDDADWYVEDQCEQIEEWLGLGFVCAQVFITGVKTRFEALAREDSTGSDCTTKALQLGPKLNGFDFTVVEAINVVANYWKHSEQWPTRLADRGDCGVVLWDKDKMKGKPKCTAGIVEKLGMKPFSPRNLQTAAKILGATEEFGLSAIQKSVLNWAENLYETAKAERGRTQCR